MLYSAMALKGAEVVARDGTPMGRLVDAYANTETDVVELLIVDGTATGGAVRLIPADTVSEYNTDLRVLTVNLSTLEAAGCEVAPEGIPVMLEPRGEKGGFLIVVTRIVGFIVQAKDGSVGQASDFLVDSDGLVIRFMVVDTRDWLPGSDKLIPIPWVESVDWQRSRVFLKITQAKAKTCQRASAGSHLLDRG
jgi:sporulation protein YlmC with PRC-barrel domain